MFNNKGPEPLAVSPVFYSLSGVRLDLPTMTIPAKSFQEVDLRDLLSNYFQQFKEGSLQVSHQGGRLQLGAQFKILKNGMIFDEQFIQPATRFPSNRLESVWWRPSTESETKFIISNTTNNAVTATVEVEGTEPQQQQPTIINLNPHETRVLDILQDLVGQQNGTIKKDGGISITHTGGAGAIMARILVSEPDYGYSSVVNFTDPTTAVSSKLNGGGLRIGAIGNDNLKPIVVARNIGTTATTISGQIPYTNANGDVAFVQIPATQINAGKTKHLNLRQEIEAANIPSNVTFAGINLEYSTAPGTVLMNVLSVSQSGQQVFQVPLLDPERLPSSAGGFPWKVDGDYTTVIFIKNESNTPKKYNANLTYNGGSYSTGVREVKPWQTVMLDFKQMRDSQTPDSVGQTVPLNIESGQLSWSMFGADNKHMSGRSEQINTVTGIASTYACYNCCPDNYYSTGETFPELVETGADENFLYYIQTDAVNCYGQSNGTVAIPGNSWTSSNTPVATIANDGNSLSISPGTSVFTGFFDSINYGFDGRDCIESNSGGTGDGQMEVRPPTVTFDEIGSIESGGTKTINARITNAKNTQITFGLTNSDGNPGGVSFPDGSYNTTHTPTTNNEVTFPLTIKGSSGSNNLNDYRIRAFYNNGTVLTTKTFTVSSVKFEATAACAGFDDSATQTYLFVPKSNNNTVIAKIFPNGATGTFNLQAQSGITVSPTSVSNEQTLTVTSAGNAGTFTLQALANQATEPAKTLNVLVRNRIDKTVIIHSVTEDNDDVQASPQGSSGKAITACVTVGNNGFRDTIASNLDQVVTNSSNQEVITNGDNQICDTTANSTDTPPPSNIPSASALQSSLNNTYWGKQANVYFTVTTDNQNHSVNYDLDRNSTLLADPSEAGLISQAVWNNNYDINLYYQGLNVTGNAFTVPDNGESWFEPNPIGGFNYVTAHEIGHTLEDDTNHSNSILDLMYDEALPTTPCRIRKRDWDLIDAANQ